jgi:hypothetical protein
MNKPKLKLTIIYLFAFGFGIFLFFQFLSSFGIFRAKEIKEAEQKFTEANGFSVIIDEIDTFTNERFAKIFIKEMYSYSFTDSLLKNPADIYFYSLKVRDNRRQDKFLGKYSDRSPLGEFSSINGGLATDKDFKRIENPLGYRMKNYLRKNNIE